MTSTHTSRKLPPLSPKGNYVHTAGSGSAMEEQNPPDFAQKTTKKLSTAVRLFPVLFFLIYLNATIFLFVYGPWPYPVIDPTKLYLFVGLAHSALLLGYLFSAFRRPRSYFGRPTVKQLLVVSIIVNLFLLIPTSWFRTGSPLPPVWAALQDLGDAYFSGRELRQAQTPIIEYVRALFGPVIALLLPLTVYFWKTLSLPMKLVAVFAILTNTAIGVAMGVNRELFFVLFLSVWLYFSSFLSGSRKFRMPRPRYVIVATIAFIVFFAFFSNAMLTRRGGQTSFYFSGIGAYADTNNSLVRDLPPDIQLGAIGMSSYLTQGYYALYLSLEKPFIPMYGVGNSMFVTRQAIRLTGIEQLADLSYPDRIMIEDGWNSYTNYTTIYPWIASDVSFPGTVFVMFLIGALFALSWLDTLRGDNPFAVVMFGQFTIMMATVPTVNWVLNSGEGFTTFWVLLAAWLFTRYRWTWKRG